MFLQPGMQRRNEEKFVRFIKTHPKWEQKPKLSSSSRASANAAILQFDANPVNLELNDEYFDLDVDSGLMEAASDSGAGDKLLCQQILLDSGSDQCILNQFYRHLFLKLEPITYGCSLSGIGGKVSFQITHIGCISFMNRTIDNVYLCSELSKSVIAESILTATYDFRIVKEGVNCIITDTLNSLSATVKILFGSDRRGGHYLLPVGLFAHSPLIHSINLASVRPSNPLTLWHERLGHSHTALIRFMARSQLYRERGLTIPDSFLLPEKDPDLCDTCALGNRPETCPIRRRPGRLLRAHFGISMYLVEVTLFPH